MGLLGSLLSSPVKGLGFVFNQINDNIDREFYDETVWQQKLLSLQMRYEMGEVDEEQYQLQEEAIVAQLDLISARRFGGYADYEDEEEDLEEDYDELLEQTQEEPAIEVLHHESDFATFTSH